MKQKRVKAVAKLLPHQKKFVLSKARFPGLVGGYGCGKTDAALYRMLHLMFLNSPSFRQQGQTYIYGLYEPTYDLIKKVIYPKLTTLLENLGLKYKLNKQDKVISIKDLGVVLLRSMDSLNMIVGYQHADCGIDELDILGSERADLVFQKVMERNRLKKYNGTANTISITTTPEGYGFMYNTYVKNPLEGTELIKGKTRDNIFLPSDYIENLLNKYPDNLIKAYLEGEFTNLDKGTVYVYFDRKKNGTNISISEDDNEIHIGMDFNVGKMSAVVGLYYPSAKLDKLFIVDEIHGVLDTPSMINEILKRYKGKDIYVYPDAAGRARKSVNSSETDISLLKQAGFNVRVRSKNPRVKDRVLVLNGAFLNANGERRIYINENKCPELVSNLEKQVWNDKGEPDKTGGHDHMNDALGYLSYYYFNSSNYSGIISSPI